jgi:hypothetical protein
VTVRATSDNDAHAEAIVVALGVFANSKGLADAIVTGLANTEALVGTTAALSVPGGDVLVEAISDNNAIAHTAGGAGALVSLAELKPTATVGGGTTASFDGDLSNAATLTVADADRQYGNGECPDREYDVVGWRHGSACRSVSHRKQRSIDRSGCVDPDDGPGVGGCGPE